MLEQINNFDQSLFFGINEGMSNPFFDLIMPYLRNRFFWIPLYLFLAIFLVKNYERQGWLILIGLGLSFAIADYTSSSILKPAFERLRPCNDPDIKADVNTRIACGAGFSLPSSHAANHFALAMFLVAMFSAKWKPMMPLALFWAATVSFAQIYSGVHYPFDILFGALLGSLVGYLLATILLSTNYFTQWQPQK